MCLANLEKREVEKDIWNDTIYVIKKKDWF